MKITLLLAFFAFVINSFGQGKGPSFHGHSSASHSSHDTYQKLQNADVRIPSKFDFDKLIFAERHQLRLLLDPVQLLDSIYQWTWDNIGNEWSYDWKYNDVTYDFNNNLLGATGLSWDESDNSWKPEEQIIFTYDVNNNLTSLIYKLWNGIGWENTAKGIIAYDINNNLTSELFQSWNGNEWGNYGQHIYIYDANNNQISWTSQLWEEGDWTNESSYINTYDVNNNQITVLYQEWNGIAWNNYNLTSNAYDTHNNLTHKLYQNWNGTEWLNNYVRIDNYNQSDILTIRTFQLWYSNAWVNYSRSVYIYDTQNNIIKISSQEWNTSTWNMPNYMSVFGYDENNNQISQQGYQWLGFEWGLDNRFSHVYDADNFIVSEVYMDYYYGGTGVNYGDSAYIYFHTVMVSVDQLADDQGSISIWPNPSNGKFTLSGNNFDKIEIFNLLGERIFTSNQVRSQTNAEIDLSQYGFGVYCVLIHDGQEVYTRKIVVQ